MILIIPKGFQLKSMAESRLRHSTRHLAVSHNFQSLSTRIRTFLVLGILTGISSLSVMLLIALVPWVTVRATYWIALVFINTNALGNLMLVQFRISTTKK